MADSATYTPETLQRRYAMAQALLADPKTPIKNWAEGLNELAKGALGGYQFHQTEKLEAGQREQANQQVMQALGLGQPAPASAPAPAPATPSSGPAPAPAPQVLGAGGAPATPDAQGVYGSDAVMLPPGGGAPAPDFGKAIAGIESAGQKDPYAALGPVTKTGDRAYGKYQVMGTNIPAWTKEHLGQEMTPEQFLANPQAQDAVFKGQFGKYVQQTGNPQDAASMWFTGKPLAQGAGLSDQLGTTGQGYVDKFNAGLGGAAPSPAVGAIATALNGPAGAPPATPPAAPPVPAGAAPTPAVSGVAQALSSGQKPPLAGPAGVGANPNARAIAAVLTSPWVDPAVKAQVMSQASPSFGFQTLPDGTIVRTDPKKGTVDPIYQAPTKPDFGVIGKDLAGNDIHGFIDKTTKTVTDINGKPVEGGTAANIPKDVNGQPLQGQDLLAHWKKTDPKVGAIVEAIIRGDASVTGRNLQQYLPLATLVDPTLQQFNYDSRKKTELDYGSAGKSGLNIKSLNTVGGHLDKMMDAYDKMGNVRVPLANTVKNAVGSGLGGGAPGAFETAATGVANELGTVFRSHGMSDSEVKSWRDRISSSASPEQFKENMSMLLDMLKTRRDVLGEQYKSGSGKDLPTQTFSKLDAAIEKINKRLNPQAEAAKPEAAPGQPSTPQNDPLGIR